MGILEEDKKKSLEETNILNKSSEGSHYQINAMEDTERKIDMQQIRLKSWKLCRNYLTGVWKTVKNEDLIIDEIKYT